MKGKATATEKRLLMEGMKNGTLDCSLRYLEEAFGTEDFTSALADVAHNAAIKGYQATPARWRQIVSVKTINDFKAQYATQVDGIGKLDSKLENEPYYEAKPTDRKESYTPTRWGKIFPLTMEAKANDVTGELNRVFTTWGAAAANTLNYYVYYTLMDANPNMADGSALFLSGRSNIATSAALSYSTLSTGMAAMMNQTDSNGEPVNVYPRYLIVNPAEYETGYQLTRSPLLIASDQAASESTLTGSSNPWNGVLELIVAPEVTAGHWFLMADPNMYPTFELGFYQGKTEPDILMLAANADSDFYRDSTASKIRLVFGGVAVDYRTMYQGQA